MKASDVFRETDYVMVQKVQFEKAFPQIKEISVTVEEYSIGIPGSTTQTYTKNNLGEFINCSNNLCYNGGFSAECSAWRGYFTGSNCKGFFCLPIYNIEYYLCEGSPSRCDQRSFSSKAPLESTAAPTKPLIPLQLWECAELGLGL